jgi:TMEM175 potassium channel family protein
MTKTGARPRICYSPHAGENGKRHAAPAEVIRLPSMGKSRLEAFSDGVIAILITIMVLELKVPETDHWEFGSMYHEFIAYVVSFVMLGIYWNNHHHLLHTVDRVSGRILWANMHLLFWLSLIPFGTAWAGQTGFQPVSTAFYGGVLLLAGCAYWVLTHSLIKHQGPHSRLARAVRRDFKGVVSIVMYAIGIVLTLVEPWLSIAMYVAVALIWFIPDRRIETRAGD